MAAVIADNPDESFENPDTVTNKLKGVSAYRLSIRPAGIGMSAVNAAQVIDSEPPCQGSS
ncbi:hypothetical protein [Rhodococcus opacus]|uniref:hypothetical protein n=1 Tax=Rhodococcus opacus TaxID=37919 RepID=UPI000B2E68FF|nr:hypothetical protein [Rhodococcus opacus]